MGTILNESAEELCLKLFGVSGDKLHEYINNELTQMNLDGILDSNKILSNITYQKQLSDAKQHIHSVIPEGINIQEIADNQPVNPIDSIGQAPSLSPAKGEIDRFPKGDIDNSQNSTGATIQTNYTSIDGNTNIDQGTSGSAKNYSPKLPSFLEKIDPASILIFSTNEVAEGGENLSNKPFRTLEDPDIKKSMQDFWLESGKQRADVYICKAEKIGSIDFNYVTGNSNFSEKRIDIDTNQVSNYQDNPYSAKPSIEIEKEKELDATALQTYIKSSMNLEKVVSDMVQGILRDYFTTNKTRAVNDDNDTTSAAITNEMAPVMASGADNMADDPLSDNGFGMSTASLVKPMEESKKPGKNLDLKMIDVVNNFKKVQLPIALQESIKSGDNKFLTKTGEEVEELLFEGEQYYLPVNKISYKTGYVSVENSGKKVL